MGERLPLTFPDWETFREFQKQVWYCFHTEKIKDAVIMQIGAATCGWETDPDKPMAPWNPTMPADFVIFSEDALVQAMEADLKPDRSLVWEERYVTFLEKSEGDDAGFDMTPIGRKLNAIGAQWQKRIEGNPPLRFRLCMATEPFTEGPFMHGLIVLDPQMMKKLAKSAGE